MPNNIIDPLSVFDELPVNVRSICRCERPDLSDKQKASYAVWCTDYATKKRGVTPSTTPTPSVRITPNPPKPPASHGLGDAVASALATFGITPERVTAFIGAPCGCAERKAKLNAIGNWMSSWLLGSKEPPPVP